MNEKEPLAEWNRLSQEAMEGLQVWRKQHPRASLREIEAELDQRLARLRAQMLQDTALQSPTVDWETTAEAAPPVCPECGAVLQASGWHSRELQSQGETEIVLARQYGVCPTCGVGFFPLDEELGLLPGSLTPHAHECLVRLGAWLPFGQSAKLLAQMLRVKISGSTARRYTEAAGAAYEAIQTEAVPEIERCLTAPPLGPQRQLLSVDGAMVPLVKGEWAEVKTLAMGEVRLEPSQGQPVSRTQALSYFSRLTDADSFTRLALVETHRRGLETAQQVAAVSDGAEWNQRFVEVHRPDAGRILDFPHAAQRISQIGALCFASASPASQQWLTEQLHTLKHQGPAEVLVELQRLKQAHPDQTILTENLSYLQKRQDQMQYPTFQAQGWPIGSGSVESANKLVVEARLKGAGMHWTRAQVNPMLALRNLVCNDRWTEAWPAIATRLCHQAAQQRRQLQKQRRAQLKPRPPQDQLPVKPVSLAPPPPQPTPPAQPYRPAANHPWRRSPVGRARFVSPSTNSKS